ncbi:hypothetical protein Mucpa_4194 [Mucilaginibacter paludis DSM 18603]|uniref:Uncharacterized protein n=1 Tax=Mucilaginibacter paludis DSM 18603 TaxID=714943 RepID=H1Y4V7_9SPHI|nr:hypothetical protein Mucpa_4194 [Mucilaginibacter paludis DSM 18603]
MYALFKLNPNKNEVIIAILHYKVLRQLKHHFNRLEAPIFQAFTYFKSP